MKKGNKYAVSITMRVVAYLSLLALLFVYIAPFVSPAKVGLFSMFGLVAPVVIAINIIIGLYCLVRMSKLAIIYVLMLILGLGYGVRIMRMPVLKDKRPEGTILKVATFNVHCFTKKGDFTNVIKPTIKAIDSIDAGIVCFQEFMTSKQHILDNINKGMKKYPYHHIYNIADEAGFGRDNYMAIYSKYKILNKGYIDFESETCNGSMFVDVLYRGDTVRVVNNHLQTSNVTSSDIYYLTRDEDFIDLEVVDDKNQSVYRLLSICAKLNANNKIRAVQADTISKFIKSTRYPIIVCGDNNDTPITYSYRQTRGELKDAFVEKGKWYGYTFKPFSRLLRIDFVFHSKHFTTVSYESPNILYSDHKPVIVEMKYNK